MNKKRLFVSIKPTFIKDLYREKIKQNTIKNIMPQKYKHDVILFYDEKTKKLTKEYNDSYNLLLMPDSLKELPSQINVCEHDYLIFHKTFLLKNKFEYKKRGHTQYDDDVYCTVFNAILNGAQTRNIAQNIIDILWPNQEAEVKDRFLIDISNGLKPSDILDKDDLYKGVNMSLYKKYYICFDESNYLTRKNEEGVDQANQLYEKLRDKMFP